MCSPKVNNSALHPVQFQDVLRFCEKWVEVSDFFIVWVFTFHTKDNSADGCRDVNSARNSVRNSIAVTRTAGSRERYQCYQTNLAVALSTTTQRYDVMAAALLETNDDTLYRLKESAG